MQMAMIGKSGLGKQVEISLISREAGSRPTKPSHSELNSLTKPEPSITTEKTPKHV